MENRLQRDKKKSTETRPLQKFKPATEVPVEDACRAAGVEVMKSGQIQDIL